MKKPLFIGAIAIIIASAVANAGFSAYQKAMQDAQQNAKAQKYAAARNSLLVAQTAAQGPNEKVDVLLNLGQTYNDEKNYSKAREVWLQAVRTLGASATQKLVARSGVAGSYLAEKRWKEARSELAQVASDAASDANVATSARLAIAGSYQDEKDFVKADEAFRAIVSNPKAEPVFKFAAQQGIAEGAFSQGDFERARDEFTKATQTIGIGVAEKALVQARIVESYRREGNTEQAARVSSGFESELAKAARNFFVAKNYEQARLYFSSALTVAGDHAKPSYQAALQEKIGETYLGQGRTEQARLEFKAVLNALAGTTQDTALKAVGQLAQLMIAVSYGMEGKQAQAKAEYQKTLQLTDLNPGLKARAEQGLTKLSP